MLDYITVTKKRIKSILQKQINVMGMAFVSMGDRKLNTTEQPTNAID